MSLSGVKSERLEQHIPDTATFLTFLNFPNATPRETKRVLRHKHDKYDEEDDENSKDFKHEPSVGGDALEVFEEFRVCSLHVRLYVCHVCVE